MDNGYLMAESKTIFIIEDDADVLSIMVKHLMREGYQVITAVDGMEGLKKLETETYDLVITDIVMPYVSGVGVVSAMKEKKPTSRSLPLQASARNLRPRPWKKRRILF